MAAFLPKPQSEIKKYIDFNACTCATSSHFTTDMFSRMAATREAALFLGLRITGNDTDPSQASNVPRQGFWRRFSTSLSAWAALWCVVHFSILVLMANTLTVRDDGEGVAMSTMICVSSESAHEFFSNTYDVDSTVWLCTFSRCTRGSVVKRAVCF